jgi:capsular polysaccharide biosynthesis protein
VDVAQILGQLWRRRGLVALGALLAIAIGLSVAYRPSLSHGLEKRSLELGTASTRLLIDTQSSSSVTDLAGSIGPLSERAQTYSALAQSEPILKAVARDMGLPRDAIVANPTFSDEQGAPQRSESIAKEDQVYRVAFNTTKEQPVLDLTTQAPSGAAAAKLANSVARTLRDFVVRQQDAQKVPPGRRLTVRQLGAARGGTINSGANMMAAVLGGLAVFVAVCLLILFGDRLRADMRRMRGRAYAGQGARSPLIEVAGDTEARRVEDWRSAANGDAVDDLRRSRSRG